MRRAIRVAILLFCSSVVAPGGESAADPDVSEPLRTGLTGFSDMVLDQEHERLFVGQGDGSLVVLGVDGSVVHEFTSVRGTTDLALDRTSDRVYAARPAEHEITIISTASLTVTHVPTGELCPHSVAPVGTVLWFTAACDRGPRTINAVDLQTGAVHRGTEEVTTIHTSDLVVESAFPSNDRVVLRESSSAGWVGLYEARIGPSRPELVELGSTEIGFYVRDVEFTPDGEGVVIAESGGDARVYSTKDLSPVSPYYETASPPLAFRSDGTLAVADASYRPGTYQAQNQLFFGGDHPLGYAWGRRLLYAVTYDNYWETYQLQVINPRAAATVTLTRSARRIDIGGSVGLDLTLAAPSSAPRKVIVRAVSPDGTKTVVGRPTIGPDGATLKVSPRRNTVFEASYAGDRRTSPAHDSARVLVRSTVRVVRVSDERRERGVLYGRSGRPMWFTVRASTFRQRGCVSAYTQVQYFTGWYPTNEEECVPLRGRRTVTFGVRTRAGMKPYHHRIVLYVDDTADNRASRAVVRDFQLCPRRLPCEPPPPEFDGVHPVPGPKVQLIVR